MRWSQEYFSALGAESYRLRESQSCKKKEKLSGGTACAKVHEYEGRDHFLRGSFKRQRSFWKEGVHRSGEVVVRYDCRL
jgi:hypothetical protein